MYVSASLRIVYVNVGGVGMYCIIIHEIGVYHNKRCRY